MKRIAPAIVVIAAIAGLVALAFYTPPVDARVTRGVPGQQPAPVRVAIASINIKAPAVVKVGQLAILDVSGSSAASFSWQVVPATANFQVIDGGKRAVFSTSIDETATSFMFIIGGAKGDTIEVKTWTIAITGRDTNGNTSMSLADKVTSWCAAVQSPTKHDDLVKMSQTFSSVAEAAKAGTSTTAEDMVKATAQANLKALGADNLGNWKPFFVSLQAEMKSLDAAGKLPDTEAHIAVWEQIADALKANASE
jgi:hypothetical protein